MKKNPMTLSSSNIRRWLYLYVPHHTTLANPLNVMTALLKYFNIHAHKSQKQYKYALDEITVICDNWQAIYMMNALKWKMHQKWKNFINNYDVELLYEFLVEIQTYSKIINRTKEIYSEELRRNPVTRTWNNLRRWIFLNLPKYKTEYGTIDVFKARLAAEKYFDVSPDPITDLISKKSGTNIEMRHRLFDEELRRSPGLRRIIPQQYIRKYRHENNFYYNAINYFAYEYDQIQEQLHLSKFQKDQRWRKVALEDPITMSDIEYDTRD